MTLVRRVWAALPQWQGLLVVGATLGLGLVTVDVLAGGLATSLDEQVADAVGVAGSEAERGTGRSVSSLGELGLSGGVLVISVLVTVQATFRLWPIALAVGTVGGGLLLVLALKTLTARPGPGESALPDGYAGYFPSGHAATAGLCLGTACFVLLRWRGYLERRVTPAAAGTFVGVAAAVGVGVAAVLGGYHWLTDVVGSVLLVAVVLPLAFAACGVLATGPDDVPMDREQRRRPHR